MCASNEVFKCLSRVFEKLLKGLDLNPDTCIFPVIFKPSLLVLGELNVMLLSERSFLCLLCAEKTEDDVEREAQLLEWRLTLTEERNAVMVPSAGCGIPGAPAEWYVTPTRGSDFILCFLLIAST